MAEFYIKNEAGEFVEADDKVEDRFREKSDKIVASKLAKDREKLTETVRAEIEETVRKESTDKIRNEVESEIRNKLESEFKGKLDEMSDKNKVLETTIRRKTIAAEYGFKPEVEKYLGDGTDDEMRKEAETLKANFSQEMKSPDKQTSSNNSPIQTETGIRVEI